MSRFTVYVQNNPKGVLFKNDLISDVVVIETPLKMTPLWKRRLSDLMFLILLDPEDINDMGCSCCGERWESFEFASWSQTKKFIQPIEKPVPWKEHIETIVYRLIPGDVNLPKDLQGIVNEYSGYWKKRVRNPGPKLDTIPLGIPRILRSQARDEDAFSLDEFEVFLAHREFTQTQNHIVWEGSMGQKKEIPVKW